MIFTIFSHFMLSLNYVATSGYYFGISTRVYET